MNDMCIGVKYFHLDDKCMEVKQIDKCNKPCIGVRHLQKDNMYTIPYTIIRYIQASDLSNEVGK